MPIPVRIFSDFACPFCYVGSGIIDKLSEEFDLDVAWVGRELHPETPAEGVDVLEVVDPYDLEQATRTLRERGAPYGLTFCDMTRLSNSRPALEAAEFARDAGAYRAFHHAAFRAYFTEGRDIGDRAVLRALAESCGLDPSGLDAALDDGRYRERLRAAREEADRLGVKAIPCFFIADQPRLVGAVNEDAFRERLQAAATRKILQPL
ncbi:DsbA family protein [Pseudodesulfovibrio sp.]|uniref:DsbA family oxidoreductase n=1 Tax=Pseudodesulfovibrio sp. TaxID=2035812 RepID=UPI00260EDB14|nr:DsbA family protein [Pseudodesulfovibrio sp.]MDD3313208.1 DsbA family protein [Pseudodesulfovibrio sp.]